MTLASEQSLLGFATSIVPWTYLAGGTAAVIVFVLLSKTLQSPTHKNGIPLPPGPPATWFWKNPLPTQNVVREFAKLVDQYGPVVSIRRGAHVTVLIGRMEAATEIIEKEGAALVDRPRLVAAAEIHSGGMRLLLQPSGNRFNRMRRATHTHLQPKAAETYQEIQTGGAKNVILDILNDPKHHIKHAERYANSIILRVTYGKTSPTNNDDPEVVRIHKVVANFQSTLLPGKYLVDIMPWLKHLPGYSRKLKALHRYELALFTDQLNGVRRNMEESGADPSFIRTLLEHIDDHQLSNDEMAYLGGALFAAGADTTAWGITMMIMAAAIHPDMQARVQEELDDVVERDRVPTFEDSDMLPQLQAFVLEAMRWRPVTPLGFAHRATRDIVWRGQCIPAGATVIGCHWVISRDPTAFPDPEVFRPERWLSEDGRIRRDMHFYAYGFGRRVCPGQYLANRSFYINLALLLWSFRILRRPEAPIDTQEFGDMIVAHYKPFDVEFVPRMEVGRLRTLMTA